MTEKSNFITVLGMEFPVVDHVCDCHYTDLTWLKIIADLTSAEDCMLDHDGNCQAHNWFGEAECPHARAKRALGD